MGGKPSSQEAQRRDRKRGEDPFFSRMCGAASCEQVMRLGNHNNDSQPEWYPAAHDSSPSSDRGAMSQRRPPDRAAVSMDGSYLSLSIDDGRNSVELETELVSGLGMKFDFEAFGVIPTNWVKSTVRVPDAFFYSGGDAIVIEKEIEEQTDDLPLTRERRVLLALPEIAVDMQRAKWLSRRPGFNAEAAALCHLRRVKEVKATGSVILEFDYPCGVPLSGIVMDGRTLKESSVQALMRCLLKLVTSLGAAPLRLLGFIDTSMIFLNLDDTLQALVPLGCVLSLAGARATLFQACQRGNDFALAPELKEGVIRNDARLVSDMDRACITDAYAIAIVSLLALGQERVDGKDITADVSPLARDMLQKALHHEPDWRLAGEAALSHPWLREQSTQQD